MWHYCFSLKTQISSAWLGVQISAVLHQNSFRVETVPLILTALVLKTVRFVEMASFSLNCRLSTLTQHALPDQMLNGAAHPAAPSSVERTFPVKESVKNLRILTVWRASGREKLDDSRHKIIQHRPPLCIGLLICVRFLFLSYATKRRLKRFCFFFQSDLVIWHKWVCILQFGIFWLQSSVLK